MGKVFIYWTEIEDGEFPDCCLTCGADDTELVPRTLETFHYRVIYSYRRYITVDLPFCRAHRSRPWIRLGRTDASEFTQEGIWLRNVSDYFVDEMEAFREEEEDEEDRPRRRKRKKKKRRNRADDDARDSPFSQPSQPGSSSLVPYVILVVVLVPVFVVGMCCVAGMFLPGVKFGAQAPAPPGPNFNDRPPFGPIRRP